MIRIYFPKKFIIAFGTEVINMRDREGEGKEREREKRLFEILWQAV